MSSSAGSGHGQKQSGSHRKVRSGAELHARVLIRRTAERFGRPPKIPASSPAPPDGLPKWLMAEIVETLAWIFRGGV
jgi:hypothetical protein